jgi:hypothetical protein
LKAKASGERLQKVFASVLKGSEVETRQRRADQQQEYQNLMLEATRGNQQALRALQERGLIQNDRLRQTLSGLGKDDWAVTAFDRRTRKAELRVQGRHLTVTV